MNHFSSVWPSPAALAADGYHSPSLFLPIFLISTLVSSTAHDMDGDYDRSAFDFFFLGGQDSGWRPHFLLSTVSPDVSGISCLSVLNRVPPLALDGTAMGVGRNLPTATRFSYTSARHSMRRMQPRGFTLPAA